MIFAVKPQVMRDVVPAYARFASMGATYLSIAAGTRIAVFEEILDRLEDPVLAAPLVVRFELQLLGELGFGLDLAQCAATGTSADLIYVSPKSGRAVSRDAGEPWADKMLRLPGFLRDLDGQPAGRDLADGFALTGFFLDRHVLEPRGLTLTDERAHFIAALLRGPRSALAG